MSILQMLQLATKLEPMADQIKAAADVAREIEADPAVKAALETAEKYLSDPRVDAALKTVQSVSAIIGQQGAPT